MLMDFCLSSPHSRLYGCSLCAASPCREPRAGYGSLESHLGLRHRDSSPRRVHCLPEASKGLPYTAMSVGKRLVMRALFEEKALSLYVRPYSQTGTAPHENDTYGTKPS